MLKQKIKVCQLEFNKTVEESTQKKSKREAIQQMKNYRRARKNGTTNELEQIIYNLNKRIKRERIPTRWSEAGLE